VTKRLPRQGKVVTELRKVQQRSALLIVRLFLLFESESNGTESEYLIVWNFARKEFGGQNVFGYCFCISNRKAGMVRQQKCEDSLESFILF
jgi:hypothetical protein